MTELVSLAWLTVCAAWDGRSGSVPNALTLPALSIAAVAACRRGAHDAVAFGAILVVCILACELRLIGGADAKILASLWGMWPPAMAGALAGVALLAVTRIVLGRAGRFRAVPAMLLGAAIAWGLAASGLASVPAWAESVYGFRLSV